MIADDDPIRTHDEDPPSVRIRQCTPVASGPRIAPVRRLRSPMRHPVLSSRREHFPFKSGPVRPGREHRMRHDLSAPHACAVGASL